MNDGPTTHGSAGSDWAAHAVADPGAATVAALDDADPTALPGADLVDAIVSCEKAISHLQATQAALTAAFARPGVAGDLTGLTDTLTGKRGAARGPDGQIDPDLLAAHQQDYARSLAATEIAAALHIPHRTASTRVAAACELVEQLPTTWQALHAGRLDQRRATLIGKATRCLPEDLRRAAEDVIVPLAGSRIPRAVQELLDRAVIAADPDAASRREQQARRDRCVRHYPDRDGMGKIHAHLPAENAAAVYTLLDLLAQASAGTPDADGTDRGIDARRADALADIVTELLATGRIDLNDHPTAAPTNTNNGNGDGDGDGEGVADHTADPAADSGEHRPAASSDGDQTPDSTTGGDEAPEPAGTGSESAAGTAGSGAAWRGLSRHGRRPHLIVTVGLSTLAGLDRLPGHLAGHGAITAELARSIAEAYQTLAVAGIDETTGTAAAVTATVYRPRQPLADQISTLAGHCRFPSCRQPSWRCDHDHRIPFAHHDPESGGLTTLWDCDPECRRHHLFKTHAQWVAEGQRDRTIVWTSPTGHHYITRPTEYRLPGENTDTDIHALIVPATWPTPKPEPPAGDNRWHRSQHAADHDATDHDGGDADDAADHDAADADPTDTDDAAPWRPSPEMRRYLQQLDKHRRQMDRFRTVADRFHRLTRGPHPGGPGRAEERPRRRRRPRHQDYLDRTAVERAMHRAAGQPDPDDEPPPF